MKICLLGPPQKYKNKRTSAFTSLNEYLGIAYSISLLRNYGFQADMLYYNTESMSSSDICQQILEGEYTMIGFPSYYYSQIQLARIMNFVHRSRPDSFFFLGGFLSSLSLDCFQKLKYLQCAIIGECEQTLLELAIAIKNSEEWRNIFGLAYIDNGILVRTARRDLISNLDTLPFPYRESGHHDILPLITSRGCYGKCNYCGLNEFYRMSNGPSYRRRSPQNVVQEIVELQEQHAVKHIQISDGNFHIASKYGRDWFEEFYHLIKAQNINLTYSCYMRVNEIISASDLLKKFHDIGLIKLFIGVESFVQSDLDFYQKQVTVNDNIKALAIAEDLFIEYDLGLILFNPITTPGSILEFIRILKQIKFYQEKNRIVKPISVNSTACALKGTPLYNYIKQNNLMADNLRGYKFLHPQTEYCYDIITTWSNKLLPLVHQCYELNDELRQDNFQLMKAAHDLFFLDLKFIESTVHYVCAGGNLKKTERNPLEEFEIELNQIKAVFR